ncbi:benzoylformate decarboxylase [Amycolatopsis bartoniae]|uniref:Benzoylformate decarboxylase n=1 Tax=Amycolatopsis bartoniae TaxID=941986 RepID=A0A8H9IUL7_9PSEU|nr:thiamine pyrophosphate-dependent enzyme [Amycolatopsis bartoniae]MBB2940261.1 benzoylformate decarboxylase [Amycolatopsis bartoniae]TVT10160.1 benzoylformate decarboxylase [Amycolatopsis bartoniae]GHF35236.1 benzoylformate decarboxylase [Amycolatopsis bartoniae]
MTTVRDAVFGVLRRYAMTTIFANPGSTEISFLTGLPDDFEFRLALHEGSVVGLATGWAMGRGRPAFVNLHTTAGLANAAGALATARTNRMPLVVVVGQQDRRHVAHEPFLTGRLEGLLGDYPVWTNHPVRAQDVPAAIARAHHEAVTAAGPAIVVVPMDDWEQEAGPERGAAPLEIRRATPSPDEIEEVAGLVDRASSPVIVAGAGADSEAGWAALVELAERLGAPVWQEPFGARAGFPQDHPAFAGHLPAGRSGVRAALAGHDLVLVVGAPVLRQYPWEPGDLVPVGTTVLQVTQHADEAHGSIADVALIADPASSCRLLAGRVRPRQAVPARRSGPEPAAPPEPGQPLRPAHVFDLLAAQLPPETVLVEESPSSRPELHRRVPARAPLGFVSAAAGGLGFGLPAAVGLKLGLPRRPVVAVLGDGSSLYGIQGLWSAAHYDVGVLFVVMANGAYAIMDRLAENSGLGKAPWPGFTEVRLSQVAEGLGCPARRVSTHDELRAALDEVLPSLASRSGPLVLDIDVAADATYG